MQYSHWSSDTFQFATSLLFHRVGLAGLPWISIGVLALLTLVAALGDWFMILVSCDPAVRIEHMIVAQHSSATRHAGMGYIKMTCYSAGLPQA